jgi:hypothetical protein
MKRTCARSILLTIFCFIVSSNHVAAQQNASPKKSGDTPLLEPAKFIRIYEDVSGGKEILLYSPESTPFPNLQSLQLKADAGSVLRIEVDLRNVPETTVINSLYMSAELSRDKSAPIEVLGYSQIGVDKQNGSSQTAVSYQTAGDLQENVSTIYWSSVEILERVYSPACVSAISTTPTSALSGVACNPAAAPPNAAVLDAFRLHAAEIQSITKFLADPKAVQVTGLIGNEIFGVSTATLQAIATEYADDLKVLNANNTFNPAASTRLLDRTKLVLRDICLAARDAVPAIHCDNGAEMDAFFESGKKEAIRLMRGLAVDGKIMLGSAKGKDGDTLRLRIEAASKAAAGGAATTEFEINLKNYGAKISISPSLLFITRAAVNDADLKRVVKTFDSAGKPVDQANPIKALSGSPNPGVTFALTGYHRGQELKEDPTSKRKILVARSNRKDKLLSGLAPGVGVNATFMSFADPRDFDPASNQFTKTSGKNFQIGAGLIGSVFNNAVQFTYGFNLNETQKRRYFGFGFGFIEVGKALAGYIKKAD